jgi:hypothetical protein
VYAVEVIGQFPPQDEEFMREEGIIWQCKPASNGNAE